MGIIIITYIILTTYLGELSHLIFIFAIIFRNSFYIFRTISFVPYGYVSTGIFLRFNFVFIPIGWCVPNNMILSKKRSSKADTSPSIKLKKSINSRASSVDFDLFRMRYADASKLSIISSIDPFTESGAVWGRILVTWSTIAGKQRIPFALDFCISVTYQLHYSTKTEIWKPAKFFRHFGFYLLESQFFNLNPPKICLYDDTTIEPDSSILHGSFTIFL